MAELPVEPRLGKMIIFAVVLKCLDPVVVLSCAMAYKDPCKQTFISSNSFASFVSFRSFPP